MRYNANYVIDSITNEAIVNPKNWTVRRTTERDELMERLREKIKSSGREIETIYGVPTTSGIIEEALKELDKQLSKQR